MTKHFKFLISVSYFAIALVLATGSMSSSYAAEVILRAKAQPMGGIIRLGDVAQIRADNGNEASRLRAIPLMPAPAGNSTHTISSRRIQDWLSMMGEDLTQHTFSGPIEVTLGSKPSTTPAIPVRPNVASPGSSTLSNDDVTKALTRGEASQKTRKKILTPTRQKELIRGLEQLLVDYIRKTSGLEGPWEVKVVSSPGIARRLDDRTSPPEISGGRTPWNGNQRFTVSFLTAERLEEVNVNATVSRKVEVVVARQPIENNQLITAADVALEYVIQDGRSSRVQATQLDDVIGLISKRPVPVGNPILLSSLQAPLMVRRGETIEVYARGGGISVRTYMIAKNDGLSGDLIQLETLESKELLYGKVVGRGEVQVFSGGR